MPSKHFGLSAKALIQDDHERYLLIRRSPDSRHFAGQWDLPGGKVDNGERLEVALRREIKEETGLRVLLDGLLGAVEFAVDKVAVICIVLKARSRTNHVRISNEHDKYCWVEAAAISRLPVFDPIKLLLKTFISASKQV